MSLIVGRTPIFLGAIHLELVDALNIIIGDKTRGKIRRGCITVIFEGAPKGGRHFLPEFWRSTDGVK